MANKENAAQHEQQYHHRCKFCKNIKHYTQFSRRQLHMKYKACKDCTAKTISHIRCRICLKLLALKHFSNKERKLGNKQATCRYCVLDNQIGSPYDGTDSSDSSNDQM